MINIHDPAYRQIKAWCEHRLRYLREQNDAPEMDSIQTAVLRGRISMLKELLSLERVAQASAPGDGPE